MEKFTSYEVFSSVLVCILAVLMRLGAEVNKRRETKEEKYKLTAWKVVYTIASCFLAGFLSANYLHESTLGNGKKMLLVFLASFLSTAGVDALMLVNGKMILHEVSKWLASKTGQPYTEPEPDNSSPSNLESDEADDTKTV